MSKTNENHIKRQWQIIQFLIHQDGYVSSDDVLNHLLNQGFEAKERTVQRDLNALAEIFPIECRRDDKPYSWRWQRVGGGKKNKMSYEQALVFMLVDNELREFLPDDLLDRLRPLFMKAKMVMAGVDYTHSDLSKPSTKTPHPKNPKKKWHNLDEGGYFGGMVFGGLRELFAKPKPIFGFGLTDDDLDKDSLLDLQSELEQLQLPEFAAEVSEFIRKNGL